MTNPQPQYNNVLFGGGLRKQLHLGRYKWIQKELKNLKYNSVFELGCYDGKLIDWIPENENIVYLGADANWDSGLDIANRVYTSRSPTYNFIECTSVEQLPCRVDEFDISICMETFEHIGPAQVDAYLHRMSQITKNYTFITVPNEIGPVFFFKTIAKQFNGSSRNYTALEFIYHCIGMTEKVTLPKGKGGHKGFGYRQFIEQASKHFTIIKIVGIPIGIFPPYLNFGVGILAKPINV